MSINSGGEKIFPEEVEAALKAHPAVFDALVVGVADERWRPSGRRRRPAPRQARPPSLEDLAEHARTKIAGYKVPRAPPGRRIPRTRGGKPDYRWAKSVATGEISG